MWTASDSRTRTPLIASPSRRAVGRRRTLRNDPARLGAGPDPALPVAGGVRCGTAAVPSGRIPDEHCRSAHPFVVSSAVTCLRRGRGLRPLWLLRACVPLKLLVGQSRWHRPQACSHRTAACRASTLCALGPPRQPIAGVFADHLPRQSGARRCHAQHRPTHARGGAECLLNAGEPNSAAIEALGDVVDIRCSPPLPQRQGAGGSGVSFPPSPAGKEGWRVK